MAAVNSTTSPTGDAIARNFFLSTCIIFSLSGNIFVIVAIAQSRRMRRRSVYCLTISCASVNLFDALVNLSITLGSSIMDTWFYPDLTCQFSAFCVHFVDVLILYHLLVMSADRAVAILRKEKGFNRVTLGLTLSSIWVSGFCISVPIFAKALPSKLYPSRYSCASANQVPITYSCITFILCFILPFLAAIGLYIVVLKKGLKERHRRKVLQSQHNYARNAVSLPPVWRELNLAKFTGTLLLVWCVLVGPYTLVIYIDRIKNSAELVSLLNPSGDKVVSGYGETAILWLRHYFGILFPIVCLAWRREIRRRCCRLRQAKTRTIEVGNGAIQNGIDRAVTVAIEPGDNTSESEDEEDDDDPFQNFAPPSFKAPVLFATSEGVHVQRIDEQSESMPGDEGSGGDMSEMNMTRAIKCDVSNSRSDILSAAEDDLEDPLNESQSSMRGIEERRMLKKHSDPISLSSGNRVGPLNSPSPPPCLISSPEARSKMQSMENTPVEVPDKGYVSPDTSITRTTSAAMHLGSDGMGRILTFKADEENESSAKEKLELVALSNTEPSRHVTDGEADRLTSSGGTKTEKRRRKKKVGHRRTVSDVAPAPFTVSTQTSHESQTLLVSAGVQAEIDEDDPSERRRKRRLRRNMARSVSPSVTRDVPVSDVNGGHVIKVESPDDRLSDLIDEATSKGPDVVVETRSPLPRRLQPVETSALEKVKANNGGIPVVIVESGSTSQRKRKKRRKMGKVAAMQNGRARSPLAVENDAFIEDLSPRLNRSAISAQMPISQS